MLQVRKEQTACRTAQRFPGCGEMAAGRLPWRGARCFFALGDPFWPEEEERPIEILASTPAGGGD
jgi:hypothetical protein